MRYISQRCYEFDSRRSGGFTLTELAVVLAIISFLFVFLMPTSTALLNNQKRQITTQKLVNIETALINFVAINKRLPCPADGTIAGGAAGAGVEGGRTSGDCTNQQAAGVVPWVSLGLSEADVIDGWERRVTYRAAFSLTRDNVLNMTSCDPAGTGAVDTSTSAAPGGRCLTSCVGTDMSTCTSPQNYLAAKGFDLRDGAGTTLLMDKASYTGAAFVLISHGENGYGSFNREGVFNSAAVSGIAGAPEATNINGSTVIVNATTPSSANTFRDTGVNSGTASNYFDDVLVRPSVFSVIQRAQLGPRSH